MIRAIEHVRHQHAVGHGFFHTGSVRQIGGTQSFEYVYDCGARNRKDFLHPVVEEYVSGLGKRPIDMLVVSHLHADHVSGLDRLLLVHDATLAVVPYIDIFERLLILGARLNAGTATASTLQLTLDPATWLTERGVERVVTIGPGPQEPPPPGEPPPSQPPPDEPPSQTGTSHTAASAGAWNLKAGQPTKKGAKQIDHGATIAHDTPLVVADASGLTIWELKFFCWRARAESAEMQAAIAEVFKLKVDEVESKATTDWVLKQLKDSKTRKNLQACYRRLSKKKAINWTSLCMRSAPSVELYDRSRWLDTWHRVTQGSDVQTLQTGWSGMWEVAWLGTGDAQLDDEEVAEDFLKHYRDGTLIASMSLPHHGSIDNHNLSVLRALAPRLVYVACPSDSDHHPSEKVSDEVKKWLGSDLIRVAEKRESSLTEVVGIRVRD